MYTLDIKHKKRGLRKDLLMVLYIFLAVLAGVFISGLIQPFFYYAVYFPYLFGLGILIFVYYRYILAYRVILRNGILYVCRLSGDREKTLWSANVREFTYFGAEAAAPRAENCRRFVLAQNALPVRMAVLGKEAVCFQADEELERLIHEARAAGPEAESDNAG